jgi:hypothetical protein
VQRSSSARRFAAVALGAALSCGAVACASGTIPSNTTTFTGTFNGHVIVTTTTGTIVCISTKTLDGTLRMTLTQPNSTRANTTFNGAASVKGTVLEISVIPVVGCGALPGTIQLDVTRAISGTLTTLTFSASSTSTTPIGASTVTCVDTVAFTGSQIGEAVIGTLTYATTCQGTDGINAITGSGTTAIPVALR